MSTVIGAPRERVWDALTKPAEMTRWDPRLLSCTDAPAGWAPMSVRWAVDRADRAPDPVATPDYEPLQGYRTVCPYDPVPPELIPFIPVANGQPLYGYTGEGFNLMGGEPFEDLDESGTWDPGEPFIDRNGNGHKDAFYTFSDGSLVEERHDRNDDGQSDLIVTYQDRQKTRSREDSSGDGKIDTWTTYAVVNGVEIPAVIKRDSDGSGKIDITEQFETSSGKPILAKREEDTNGDGAIDVTSTYRNGKLYRRELADPTLVTE